MSAAPSPSVRASSDRFVRFGDLRRPARFTGCDDLLEAVKSILRGWRVREVSPSSSPRPAIRVKRTPLGYRRVSRWTSTPAAVREKTRAHLVGGLCGFHFEFIDWYVDEHPDELFVHGAAAMCGKRLVVFPAVAHTGKSVLTVRLALQGWRVFCDDVLPIDSSTRRGVSLGIVPRLRPPLPPDASPAFRAFVEARAGLGRGNRLYVNLNEDEMAPLGETAPIGAIVLLTRKGRVRPTMFPVDRADALEDLVAQNFARDRPTPRILETLAAVVESSDCYRLRYARTEQAVALLDEAFGPARRRGSAGAS